MAPEQQIGDGDDRHSPGVDMTARATVLIVEDEFLVRLSAVEIVVSAGLQALEATNAEEAIAILESRPDIRVVFTDVNMPGSMDGLKLAHYIRDRWPPIKLVVASGQAIIAESDLPSGARFFSKPYDASIGETLTMMAASHSEPIRDDLRQRLQAIAADIERWRGEAKRIREATQLPGAASDDALLISVEETSGAIYRSIEAFDELVADVDRTSHVAAGLVAEVGDALRLVLLEITELGTGLYGLRSPDISTATNVPHDLVEFAISSNGDRWLFGPAEGTSRAFVEHRANDPSGGAVTRTTVETFLAGKPPGPQHDALRRLLAEEHLTQLAQRQ